MLQSPSKSLSRSFLKRLTENRFISPRGKEYSPEEVTELLTEKEMRHAESQFGAELRQAKPQPTILEMFAQMRSFQDTLYKRTENVARESPVEKSTSSDCAPLLFAPTQIFPLPEKDSIDSIIEHQRNLQQPREPGRAKPGTLAESTSRGRGGIMPASRVPRFMFGCRVKRQEPDYTLDEIKKERIRMDQVMRSLQLPTKETNGTTGNVSRIS